MAAGVVLFLCTGNYYRSRFAECLFNHLAAAKQLPWRAESRGLALERLTKEGPISPEAEAELLRRGIPLNGAGTRRPRWVAEQDWQEAEVVIALRGEEHRPLVEERHPRWREHVQYWEVGDVDVTTPQQALAEVARQVEQLIERLNTERVKRPASARSCSR